MANKSVAVERRIRADADRVWQAMTDLEDMPRVLSGVDEVEVLERSPAGPFGVGTRWRETRRMLGKQATEEMYVTASEPPVRYVVEADSHGAHYVSEFVLRAEGPGVTAVRMTFTAVPPSGAAGLLAKVLGGLGARAVRKAIAKDLDDVAAAVEQARG
ncbi:polyketide cyclase/dehydrase [Streptomyces agglomeratus]|uniref:Polyketide cyclase/dehydrase n=1 Tax=Streptomyces agglomeratus TaxID=285458 RepID=A0A1E5PAJ3_9ACTN|nr:SRPBCC family protein [Streptomyces agglomeratus]OEJ26562.1 polyketide cyclase/dehydrase [Streptomyces agglomeratus]OEJ39370.1 polyketide cyclase/dehydrase [Streptomyces agglomeratus]OEJ46246.1 polyketide cyclase/dehydrase [Streptomyces agglomeratus]OEJ51891.1 polyketide cyclase/dehydrase [Streptomyces agglomeratus]OEJ59294.1 polyketide cyclase/dehydrase [Streptomyces agglomeratus]